MAKIVRNILPGGKRLKELELTRVRDNTTETILLTPESRIKVRSILATEEPATTPISEVFGILRAVDLDGQWVEIAPEEGQRIKCVARELLLDEIVGPMVNRRVALTGEQKRGRFTFSDIELRDD